MPTGGRSSRRSSQTTIASSPRPSPAWGALTGATPMFRAIRARGARGGAQGRRVRRRGAGRRRPLVRRAGCDGLVARFRRRTRGAVMVDPPFFAPQNQRPRSPPRPARARRVQHSLSAIVARFRLQPAQRCDNPFILDLIARRSAHEAVDADGKPGWALCFDPHFWEKFNRVDRSRSSPRARRWRSFAAQSRSSCTPPTPNI